MKKKNKSLSKQLGELRNKTLDAAYKDESKNGMMFALLFACMAIKAEELESLARDLYADATLTEEKAKAYADELKALGVLDE